MYLRCALCHEPDFSDLSLLPPPSFLMSFAFEMSVNHDETVRSAATTSYSKSPISDGQYQQTSPPLNTPAPFANRPVNTLYLPTASSKAKTKVLAGSNNIQRPLHRYRYEPLQDILDQNASPLRYSTGSSTAGAAVSERKAEPTASRRPTGDKRKKGRNPRRVPGVPSHHRNVQSWEDSNNVTEQLSALEVGEGAHHHDGPKGEAPVVQASLADDMRREDVEEVAKKLVAELGFRSRLSALSHAFGRVYSSKNEGESRSSSTRSCQSTHAKPIFNNGLVDEAEAVLEGEKGGESSIQEAWVFQQGEETLPSPSKTVGEREEDAPSTGIAVVGAHQYDFVHPAPKQQQTADTDTPASHMIISEGNQEGGDAQHIVVVEEAEQHEDPHQLSAYFLQRDLEEMAALKAEEEKRLTPTTVLGVHSGRRKLPLQKPGPCCRPRAMDSAADPEGLLTWIANTALPEGVFHFEDDNIPLAPPHSHPRTRVSENVQGEEDEDEVVNLFVDAVAQQALTQALRPVVSEVVDRCCDMLQFDADDVTALAFNF